MKETATANSKGAARTPARRYVVDAAGIGISVVEWGDQDAKPLLLAHGGADFAQTFDAFAPLLADAGYRVICWDHRGHGDSERADLYTWSADMRDAYHVLESIGRRPIPAIGHSKGAGLLSNLCAALPERFTHFVNIDGVPWKHDSKLEKPPLEERIQGRAKWHESFLDSRKKLRNQERRPGTLEELAQRRAKQNPRLSMEWLLYLASVGANPSPDGWRWKLDPLIRMFTPGPWRPEWGLEGLSDIAVPMLGILGRVKEPMGWGTDPDGVGPYLPAGAQLEVYEDSGHFVHIEHPERTAKRVLEFLQS